MVSSSSSILECKYAYILKTGMTEEGSSSSILECKFSKDFFSKYFFMVAVAPYWNVNTLQGLNSTVTVLVAVAPYWNVNIGEIISILTLWGCSSSSILECKYTINNKI